MYMSSIKLLSFIFFTEANGMYFVLPFQLKVQLVPLFNFIILVPWTTFMDIDEHKSPLSELFAPSVKGRPICGYHLMNCGESPKRSLQVQQNTLCSLILLLENFYWWNWQIFLILQHSKAVKKLLFGKPSSRSSNLISLSAPQSAKKPSTNNLNLYLHISSSVNSEDQN